MCGVRQGRVALCGCVWEWRCAVHGCAVQGRRGVGWRRGSRYAAVRCVRVAGTEVRAGVCVGGGGGHCSDIKPENFLMGCKER